MAVHRMHLYNEGSEEREGVAETSGVPSPLTRSAGTLSPGERGRVRGGLKREEVVKVLREKGDELFTVRDLRVKVFR